MRIVCALVLLAIPSTAWAQAAPPRLDSLAEGIRSLYRSIRNNVVEAAELMPDAEYGFKPTPDVRSFGQLVGHVTNTHYNFCSAARSVASPAKVNHETLTTKTELVAALKASVAFCDAAYDETTDATIGSGAKFGSAAITVGYALTYNVAHDNEHYGNMVTYLRLKGLVPPSTSRRR
jgi:uncharacterized damage-inducible protein DinB